MDAPLTASPQRRIDGASSESPGDAHALTSRVAKGDRDALAALYEKWFERMTGMAMHATGRDEAFCMDVAQDAFIKLIRNPVVIGTDRELGAYLRRLVVTSAYDRLRSERRRAKREASRRASGGGPSEASRERLAIVESAIASLEGEQGDLLIARYRAGWTLARIGEELGLATGAVDGRIGRIVRKLRKTIEDEQSGEGSE